MDINNKIILFLIFTIIIGILYLIIEITFKRKNKYIENCKNDEKKCKKNLNYILNTKYELVFIFILNILVISLGILLLYQKKLMDMYFLMIVGNSIGTLIRYFKYENNKKTEINTIEIIKHFSLGLGACLLLPLFFNLIQSNIVDEILQDDINIKIKAYTVILSFSVLTSLFAEKVIKIVGDKVFKELQEVKENISEIEDNVKTEITDLKKEISRLELENNDLRKGISITENNIEKTFGEEVNNKNFAEQEINYSAGKEYV